MYINEITTINDLIGLKCNFCFDYESEVWNDDNTVLCEIIGVNFEVDDGFPFGRLRVGISLKPIEDKNLDEDTLHDMESGVSGGIDFDSILIDRDQFE